MLSYTVEDEPVTDMGEIERLPLWARSFNTSFMANKLVSSLIMITSLLFISRDGAVFLIIYAKISQHEALLLVSLFNAQTLSGKSPHQIQKNLYLFINVYISF